MKKPIAVLLTLALSVNLGACTLRPEAVSAAESSTPTPAPVAAVVIDEGAASESWEPGYISAEIETPDWVEAWAGCDALGDTLYFGVVTAEGAPAAASYDTLGGARRRFELATGDARYPGIEAVCAAEGSLWLLLREGRSEREKERRDYSRALDYYLAHIDLPTGRQSCVHVDFWREGSAYLCSLIALDSGRALIGDGRGTWLVSPEAQVLERPKLQILGTGFHARIGGALYLATEEGLAALDPAALRYGEPIASLPGLVYASNRGRFLISEGNALQSVDPATGARTELFSWLDTALCRDGDHGLFGWTGLENSKGDFYHLTDRLLRVSPGEVPVRKTLTLGCFGDAADELSAFAVAPYACPESLLDAVVRFNNADPEYRVEIKSMVYHDEAERAALIAALPESGVDIVDMSLLPEGAADRALLVDLLPYIDADGAAGRDALIPGLLDAMTEGGGLYALSDKFTVLTLLCRENLAPRGAWTAERMGELLARQGAACDREMLATLFSWAATAEFIEREGGACRFDSPAFAAWLDLLRQMDGGAADASRPTALCDGLYVAHDLAAAAGLRARMALKGEGVALGFPDAAGNGSYFMPLGSPAPSGGFGRLTDEIATGGCAARLGILKSSGARSGAWRFLRTVLLGEETPSLVRGIPVCRAAFERALAAELRRGAPDYYGEYEPFNAADAAALRELVYGVDQIVCRDAAVTEALQTEINAFLDGRGSAGEAAARIQRRLSALLAAK